MGVPLPHLWQFHFDHLPICKSFREIFVCGFHTTPQNTFDLATLTHMPLFYLSFPFLFKISIPIAPFNPSLTIHFDLPF